MKVLFRETTQPRRYADKEGTMLVELEAGDVQEDVIKEIEGKWDVVSSNKFNRAVTTFTNEQGKTYEGNLLVFDAKDAYMD